jgi:hypothetical protein
MPVPTPSVAEKYADDLCLIFEDYYRMTGCEKTSLSIFPGGFLVVGREHETHPVILVGWAGFERPFDKDRCAS